MSATDVLGTFVDNFKRNVGTAFTTLTAERWIRIVAIVGAYALLRPYIIKLGARVQTKEFEKGSSSSSSSADAAAGTAAGAAKISPNELRDGGGGSSSRRRRKEEEAEKEEEELEAEAEGTGNEPKWGRKATRRQRKFVERLLDEEERRRLEKEGDDEDKDIEEFLWKE